MYKIISSYNAEGMTFNTARGYRVDDSGLLTIIDVPLMPDNDEPELNGYPLIPSSTVVDLQGWPDARAVSFESGRVLVALVD